MRNIRKNAINFCRATHAILLPGYWKIFFLFETNLTVENRAALAVNENIVYAAIQLIAIMLLSHLYRVAASFRMALLIFTYNIVRGV